MTSNQGPTNRMIALLGPRKTQAMIIIAARMVQTLGGTRCPSDPNASMYSRLLVVFFRGNAIRKRVDSRTCGVQIQDRPSAVRRP